MVSLCFDWSNDVEHHTVLADEARIRIDTLYTRGCSPISLSCRTNSTLQVVDFKESGEPNVCRLERDRCVAEAAGGAPKRRED
jgi:hypothetical protein